MTLAFLENETEVSFFSRQLYEQFKVNPEVGDHKFPNIIPLLMVLTLDQMGGLAEIHTDYNTSRNVFHLFSGGR